MEDMKTGMADFIKLLSASRTLRREMGQKCVLCLHNNRSLDVFFFGGERQFTHTQRTFFVLIKCGIDTVTANTARELSICAHRLD
jgi:hypothetical protein